jgi:hypothetical protein
MCRERGCSDNFKGWHGVKDVVRKYFSAFIVPELPLPSAIFKITLYYLDRFTDCRAISLW